MKEQPLAELMTVVVSQLVAAHVPMQSAMRVIEQKFLDVALTMNAGNVTKAARQLGIHRNTLMNKRRGSR